MKLTNECDLALLQRNLSNNAHNENVINYQTQFLHMPGPGEDNFHDNHPDDSAIDWKRMIDICFLAQVVNSWSHRIQRYALDQLLDSSANYPVLPAIY